MDKEKIVFRTKINNADSDGEEVSLRTNPSLIDYNNDGSIDYLEISPETDPLAATSNPNQSPVTRSTWS